MQSKLTGNSLFIDQRCLPSLLKQGKPSLFSEIIWYMYLHIVLNTEEKIGKLVELGDRD